LSNWLLAYIAKQERYGSFSQGIGLKIENGTCSLEDCEVSGSIFYEFWQSSSTYAISKYDCVLITFVAAIFTCSSEKNTHLHFLYIFQNSA